MIKNENFVNIQGWMINELNLKGNKLLIYALIYGFTQGVEKQYFTGSLQYMADWTNSTKQGVQKALKELLEKGFIKKVCILKNKVKFVEYCATKLHSGEQQSCIGGMQQSCTNNINIDTIDNNKEKNIVKKENRFKKPSIEEIKEYCQERGNRINPEMFFNFYESKDWMIGKNRMKNWKASVRVWESKQKDYNNNRPSSFTNEDGIPY